MSVLDVLNSPWAITPEKHASLVEMYERHAAGARFDGEAVAAQVGYKPSTSAESAYQNDGGVAIIPMQGVLAKKMNLFTYISGGMSMEQIAQAIADANADPSVHTIVLDIDSPGGTVDGTQQLGDAVAASGKPTIAFCDGQCCSAAYWVAAQADQIFAASDSTVIGSIGVRMTHTDVSKANDNAGRKVTHITSGKYKAMGNSDEPLNPEAHSYVQGKVDYLNTLFVNAVATGRGSTPQTVDSTMGGGKTFFALEAVDLQMIDGISARATLIARLGASQGGTHPSTQEKPTPKKAGPSMAFKTFETEAQYNAHIAEQKAQALQDDKEAPVIAARNMQKNVRLIQERQNQAKQSGRNICVATAARELENEGLISW